MEGLTHHLFTRNFAMKEPLPYPLPTVHMNGTGRDTLIADYRKAFEAVRAAAAALAAVEFNARDYYVQGDNAYNLARAERTKQLAALHDVACYCEAHWEAAHVGQRNAA